MEYGLRGGADSAGVHTVSGGDTLYEIAERYKLAMPDIIAVNGLQPPYALESGQRLKLPPPQAYRVREGDTLYGISRTFSVGQSQIAQINNLKPPYAVAPGQTLRLPVMRPVFQPVSAPDAPPVPAMRPAPVDREHIGESTGGPPLILSGAPPPAPKPAMSVVMKAPARSTPGRFAWPVSGPVLSSYGPKKGGLHNDGVNIGAPKGSPVRAAENGVVVYAGDDLKGFGNLVLVRHADRWVTAYAHMDRLLVKKGDEIRQGQSIGTVGATGSVDDPQLHFEVRRGTEALNPEAYLGSRKT